MAWNLDAVEQAQLLRQHRVDGVGRAKFDFHTQALTNTNAAPPITTDSEILTELRRTGDAVVGRLRLVDYMNPQDPLYFDARRKAVSIADYDVRMTKCDNV